MTSRILAVLMAGMLAITPTSAKAQDGTASARKSQSGGQSTVPRGAASSGDESATVTPDSASTQDPFDSAASKLSKAGASESPSDPTGKSKGKTEKATFGAGCFWHVEAEFEWLPGVKSAVSGYAGGVVPRPSYEEVHEGVTGHAEVVQVEYDPAVISYEQLLNVFWKGHDPTQLNRQGPDVGTQYRSVIFYHSPEQRKAALKSYHELTAARVFPGPIVTQLVPMKAFYRAEDYHQNYYGGKDGRPSANQLRTRRLRKPATKPNPSRSTARSKADSGKPAARSDGSPTDTPATVRPNDSRAEQPES